MSAYIAEDHLIDFVLTFYLHADYDRGFYLPSPGRHAGATTPEELTAIGQTLVAENYRSCNARYRGELGEPHAYKWRPHRAALDMPPLARAVQVLKSCANFDYQACETDDWRQTDAHAIISRIQDAAIHSLPGYEEALWGAPEHKGAQLLPLF